MLLLVLRLFSTSCKVMTINLFPRAGASLVDMTCNSRSFPASCTPKLALKCPCTSIAPAAQIRCVRECVCIFSGFWTVSAFHRLIVDIGERDFLISRRDQVSPCHVYIDYSSFLELLLHVPAPKSRRLGLQDK